MQEYYTTHPEFIKGFRHENLTEDGLHLEADGILPCSHMPPSLMNLMRMPPSSPFYAHTLRVAPSLCPADHLYWTMNELIVMQKLFTLRQANEAFACAPPGTYEDNVLPPPLSKVILNRAKSNKLKKGGRTKLTAYNTMKIAKAR